MPLVAGVDSSTQGCKVVVIDVDTGETLRQGRAVHPEGSEVHPDAWVEALNTAIEQAGGLGDVKAIAVSGQQHGMVLLDATGHVVRPALLWNDTRSAAAARDLVVELGADRYANEIGIVPVASFTASKLRWLRDNEPENATKVAAVVLPHDYLTWRLLGYGPQKPVLDALVTDRSDASGTAYWSSVQNHYLPEFFERALGRPMRVAGERDGVNSVIVPRVLGPSEAAGTSPDGYIVGPGTGDNAGGALGLGVTPGDVVVSIGTSGAVFSPTSTLKADPTGTVAGFSDATGRSLPLVCTLNGARVFQAGCKLLGVDHDEFAKLALEATPGANGLVLIPYFEGERTPNLPEAHGSLHGLTLGSATRPNIARAFVEGVVCSMAEGIRAAEECGVETRRILLIGGAAANPAVQECASYVFTQPVGIPTPGEYVARGAAFQAAWTFLGSTPKWSLPMDKELAPKPAHHVLDNYATTRKAIFPETA